MKKSPFEFIQKHKRSSEKRPLDKVLKYFKDSIELSIVPDDDLDCPHFTTKVGQAIPSIRDVALSLKKLLNQGTKHLVVGVGDPLQHHDFTKVLPLAKKIGFEKVFLVTHGGNLPDDTNWIKSHVSHYDMVILRWYGFDKARFEKLTNKPDYYEKCKNAVEKLINANTDFTVQILVDDEPASWIGDEMETLHKLGVKSFLMSYPVAGNKIDGEHLFPDVKTLRESMVELKYHWKETPYQVGLYEYPLCALSFGEEIFLDIIPAPDILFVNEPHKSGRTFIPVKRQRVFAPNGRTGCECLQINECSRISKLYKGVPKHGLRSDYIQLSEGERPQIVIRPILQCNQSCTFCFVDHNTIPPTPKELELRIKELSPSTLTISGGEPSLYKDLPKLIKKVDNPGKTQIVLQTNAMLYGKPEKVQELSKSGLSQAFVSLHSHIPETSDEITHCKGGFEKTLKGIDNLRTLPDGAVINHVIQQANYRDLPGYVHFLNERFKISRARDLAINFSLISIMGVDFDYKLTDYIPRINDVKPYLTEALDYCLENVISFGGLDTPCGFPRCMFDNHKAYFPEPFEAGNSEEFYKPDSCKACSYYKQCFGLRPMYNEAYGADELRPIK